jgi:hypothetical protein
MGIIETLRNAYFEPSKIKDQYCWLPYHCACVYGASQTIINALLGWGACDKDGKGCVPRHYAALKSAPVMTSLLRANPKDAVNKDDESHLTKHHACSKGAPEGSG